MLPDQRVEITWSPSNKKRLENFGYVYTKTGETVMIKPQHLGKNSKIRIKVQCDYCGEFIEKIYENYIKERNKFPKDSCYECRYKKEKDILKEKQNNNQIEKGDRRYYSFKENRLREVNNYIKKYGTIDNVFSSEEGIKLSNNLYNHNDNVYELAVELGYNLKDIANKKPSWYYENFNTFKMDVEEIINKYGSFPSIQQIMRELNISHRIITYHGGIQNIRELMGYESDKYLDNNGFYNSSFYETIVANYLITQGLGNKYKREQYPFPKHEGDYRSDFTFYLENGDEVHCEVWGYRKNGSISKNYNDVREVKENLYKQYSLKLISIEPDIFDKSYNKIGKYLYNKFKDYFNLKFKTVSQENIVPSSLLTDKELLSEIMKYSDDDDCLPNTTQLKGIVTGYYNEIIKRHETYQNFADKFNKKVEFASNGYWTQEKIFEVFDSMILNHGKVLNRKECLKVKSLNKFSHIIQSQAYGGLIDNKLDYFRHLQQNNREIPEYEIKFLYDVSRGNSLEYSNSIDKDKKKKAQGILFNLKKVKKLDKKYHDYVRKDYGQNDDLLNLAFDIFIYMVNVYGEILTENKYRQLKQSDNKLDEVNIYKRIQRSDNYNLKEVKKLFEEYLKSLNNDNQQSS